MKFSQKTLVLTIAMVAATFLPLLAGTLDDAPFQLAAPDTDWKLDDSKLQPLGGNMSLAASLVNEKKHLKSVVMMVPIKAYATALDDVCAGIRSSFADRRVQKLSDETTTFLGYQGQALAYEVSPDAIHSSYNEARVFIVDNAVWVISVSGPLDQKEAVKQMLTFYRPKKN